LTVALGISGEQDGVDLIDPGSSVRIVSVPQHALDHEASARTGVAGEGAATPWRFYLSDEPTVSPYRAATRRRS
jgi:DNA-3-methyladenine glycosylase